MVNLFIETNNKGSGLIGAWMEMEDTRYMCVRTHFGPKCGVMGETCRICIPPASVPLSNCRLIRIEIQIRFRTQAMQLQLHSITAGV